MFPAEKKDEKMEKNGNMMELVCPKCEQSLSVQKYGEYVECSHCSNEFFNPDPSLVVPKKRAVIFIVRMAVMAVS